ncbi:nitric-oxide reductase large subunit [Vitiosangium sp. GDMCC 1.1324]|uniref:nitric-oxide reductase large subunit n=1 Tax=Vitiosangium sp. (strain GDMCC 1.1324) TaxID=2138576 RepID=UPI000D38BFB4|nr:nitric-oxide reductase large subunit [Vitiosangium sp. GDMCC 1.1324]PTL78646.1 nitric oxide reductase large subunit [Vitiosangium sp. GDMCC 1.1324]
MQHRKLWLGLGAVVLLSFLVLGGQGVRISRSLPPIPEKVATPDGTVLLTGESIMRGQNVWQSIGGQQLGSVWGHGAYVAPDWSADWLHREASFVLDTWARAEGAASYAEAPAEKQAALRERLTALMRTNTYDASTGTVTLAPVRAEAMRANAAHYVDVFANGRSAYAIPEAALTDPEKLKALTAFFWWTSWVASTNRPGDSVTYTQNWPHEPLVGNQPTAGMTMWSMASVVLLLAGVGGLLWYLGGKKEDEELAPPAKDPFLGVQLTPSQKATGKYFLVVVALFLVQVGLGGVTAHFGVEGGGFYGVPLAKYVPYAVTRSWHTQLGIFWIATAWLATGLFVGPAVSGVEPKYQRLGVDFLFVCLVIIVAGALFGQWASVQQRLGNGDAWYWFGHQGWEYVDLGRFWQIFLFVGLFVWLFLTARAVWPALKKPSEGRPLLVLFVISSLAIASFYGAGLMYGQRSHMGMVEYWRWWVVHLWVEGFFEVFATVVMAFLFTRLGVLSVRTAVPTVLFTTTIFLFGGIIGTFHHLYFSGTPSAAIALGATFSALEVVPLVLVGREVWSHIRLSRLPGWMEQYRWPILFFIGVAFWNLVGAGLFGFLINPPIALYYMQGLNLTPVHGHTALFGVYGMLGIALMLFSLRMMQPEARWKTKPLAWAFWCINAGLALMVVLSMLPIGVLQTKAAIEQGTWWARSAEFLQTPLMNTLRWLRVPGDTLFAVGAVLLAWFIVGLKTGWSLERADAPQQQPGSERLGAAAPAHAVVRRR